MKIRIWKTKERKQWKKIHIPWGQRICRNKRMSKEGFDMVSHIYRYIDLDIDI